MRQSWYTTGTVPAITTSHARCRHDWRAAAIRPRNTTAASAISGRTSGPRPAMNAITAVPTAGSPNRYSRCSARAQRCSPNHIPPIQQITRPVSRPEVAKSRAGGSIT